MSDLISSETRRIVGHEVGAIYSLAALAPASSDTPVIAPGRVRLFKFGENRTSKGTFFLSQDDAQACIAEWRAHSVDLHFNYRHVPDLETDDASTMASPEAAKAAGWFGLELADDGLYASTPIFMEGAVGLYWCTQARRGIEQLEWRYYSPTFLILKGDDGRWHIRKIFTCALTNEPATVGISPLTVSQEHASMNGNNNPQIPNQNQNVVTLDARDVVIVNAARAATGKTDPSEVAGAITALAEKAKLYDEQQVTAAKDKKTRDEEDVKRMLAEAKKVGKVTNATEPSLLEKGLQDPAWLKGYLANKSREVPEASTLQESAKKEASNSVVDSAPTILLGGKKFEDLSGSEQHKLYTSDKTTYDAMSEDWQRRGRPLAKKSS